MNIKQQVAITKSTTGNLLNPADAKAAIYSKKGQQILKLLAELSAEYNTELSLYFSHWHNENNEFISIPQNKIIQERNGVQTLVTVPDFTSEEVGWKNVDGVTVAVERCSHR